MSVLDGPGEGTWSVFAMKVVEERDRLRERVAELELRLARALEEIEIRRAAAASMDPNVRGVLAEYERYERHHRRYNVIFERHLATGCDTDQAHRRTQDELTKGE